MIGLKIATVSLAQMIMMTITQSCFGLYFTLVGNVLDLAFCLKNQEIIPDMYTKRNKFWHPYLINTIEMRSL